ncbi:bifunctional protein folD [Clostridium sp. CAG:715]|nr:bifunctional protein folD [Clostridium sp. CAG:715]
MAIILDGKMLRDKIFESLKAKLDKMQQKPTLAVILVGENPASQIYVRNKKKTAEKLGINSLSIEYPSDISEKELLNKIKELNSDEKVTAILVQLPLPAHINKNRIIDAILPQKDVDGLTPYNLGKLFSGEEPYVYPCTPKGILLLLDEYNIKLEGKNIVVVGRSNLVGKPVAQMLLKRNATVTMCHSHTKNLSEITKTADIIVSAVGKKVIGEKMLKSDCVVIDVGIFRDENGKISGDVDFENVSKTAAYISPVPGGVGPMTIASLMLNTVELARK